MMLSTKSNLLLLLMFVSAASQQQNGEGKLICSKNAECGWNSICQQGSCQCQKGHVPSRNKRDCVDVTCKEPGCLNCTQDKAVCQRCVGFVDLDSGHCSETCESGIVMLIMHNSHLSKVCQESTMEDGDVRALYIAITAGICSGFIITLLIGILFYLRMKRMRNDFSFVIRKGIRNLQIKEMENGQTQELFGYDNKAFEPDYHITQGSLRFEFKLQLTELRPHSDTILAMLNEARTKLAALPPQHNKVYVYKNVIHQLCRVLTLLKSPENQVEVPPDGQALLNWAKDILTEYQNIHNLRKNMKYNKMVVNNNHGNTVTLHESGQAVTLQQNGHTVTLHHCDDVTTFKEPMSNNNYKDPCSTFRYQRNPFIDEQCSVEPDDSLYSDLNVIHLLDDLTEPIEI